jgi:hypothetical protein
LLFPLEAGKRASPSPEATNPAYEADGRKA